MNEMIQSPGGQPSGKGIITMIPVNATMRSYMNSEQVKIPDWVWEFHGHVCPFMPIGYRMGVIAMRDLQTEHIGDHGGVGFSEMGVGHPQTCMMDGFMAVTGCTYGKLMMERLNYGKVACILFVPGKGAVRVYLKSGFQDELGKQEFFVYRKKGVEPSQVPADVVGKVVDMVMTAPDAEMFKVERLPGFMFSRPKDRLRR